MANAGFLLLIAVMLAGLVAAVSLLARPITSVRARKPLFTLTVLGTLMPYGIHGLQVYESLTTVSSAAGLAIGVYPRFGSMDGTLATRGRIARARGMGDLAHQTFRSGDHPPIMGIAYLFGFFRYALTNRGLGPSPTVPPKSWLLWAMLAGGWSRGRGIETSEGTEWFRQAFDLPPRSAST